MKLLLGLTFFVGTLLALAEPEGKGEQGLEGFVWQDSEGKPVSDTASMKSKDGFGGQFALTANERFYEEWARPEMPMIKKVSKLPIGKFLVPVVIFANPEKDKGGNVDVAYDLEIIKPDGSIGRTVSDVVCAKGPNKVPTFVLQLSQSERMWGAEVGDPLGVYTFKLILKDNIRGTKLPLEASVEIVEEEPYYWFSSYYRNPSPERFITEVRSLIQNDILSNEDSQLSFIAFLSQVMAANPKEITKWLEEFDEIEEEQRDVIWAAAWFSDTVEAKSFFKKKEYEPYIKEKAPKILEMEVNNYATLDMLWSYFFATGEEKSIRRLISALELSKYSGAVEKFENSEKAEKDVKEAYFDAAFQAALWSLESNCRQHPLVLKYCETIFKEQELSKEERLWLGVLLSKLKPEEYKIQFPEDLK